MNDRLGPLCADYSWESLASCKTRLGVSEKKGLGFRVSGLGLRALI